MRSSDDLAMERMPGHWALARLGKRVLRPGGRHLTAALVESLAIEADDRVAELAPGLGATAQLVLRRRPQSYVGVERDEGAAEVARAAVEPFGGTIVIAPAQQVPLDDASRTVVFGEAMLTMQNQRNKAAIVAEAARVLVPGGRYGIHETCLVPDDIPATVETAIDADLSRAIHVGARPLTVDGWRSLLSGAGFEVVAEHRGPMKLLSPGRVVADEGFARSIAIVSRGIRDRDARRRVIEMRACFRRWREHLGAVVIVARKL